MNNLKNSSDTAVVTGANGFVGSHLVDLLLEKGMNVRCLVRKSSDLKWLEGKNVEIHDCGLRNMEGLKKAFDGASYIYHVAGVVKSKKPEGYFEGNVENTRTLLETAMLYKENIKRFVVVSSQTVTGPAENGIPVNEESECKPITTYGRSKLAQEELARSYGDRLPVTICRAPAVYGERDTEIFIFFQTMSKGLMTSVGFDKKLVSLIHVTDLVEGIYLASVNPDSAGETYFISSEEFYNWQQIGNITAKVLNKRPLKVKVPHFLVYTIAAFAQFFSMFSSKAATLNIEKARDITRKAWICDTSKAVHQLGYRQKISIEEGIRRTCEWYKKMNWI